MEHYSNEELIGMIGLDAPILNDKSINKSKKALAIVGQLILLSALDENKQNGYVYRSNAELAEDVDTDEATLRRLIDRLEKGNYIERRAGNRMDKKASEYILNWNLISGVTPLTDPPSDNGVPPLSATPSDNGVPPLSATPYYIEELTKAIRALTLEVRTLQSILERTEQGIEHDMEATATPYCHPFNEATATPYCHPIDEKLPPPDNIYISSNTSNITSTRYISRTGNINKNEDINKTSNITRTGNVLNNENITRTENMNKYDIDEIYEKLYMKEQSDVDRFIARVIEDINRNYLYTVKTYEELENNLEVAKMAARSLEYNYSEYNEFSNEERNRITEEVLKRIVTRTQRRIEAMKRKMNEHRQSNEVKGEVVPQDEHRVDDTIDSLSLSLYDKYLWDITSPTELREESAKTEERINEYINNNPNEFSNYSNEERNRIIQGTLELVSNVTEYRIQQMTEESNGKSVSASLAS